MSEITDNFWRTIDTICDRIEAEKPATFDAVKAVLDASPTATYPGPFFANTPDSSFFGDGGGDRSLLGSLIEAGWVVTWQDAWYYYVARHPVTGEQLTYVEGDVLRGDQHLAS